MYSVSKAIKGKKYRVLEREEFWTPKRKAWALRQTEPVPHEEEIMRFMRERMGPALEQMRTQRAKEREHKRNVAGQKDFKPE